MATPPPPTPKKNVHIEIIADFSSGWCWVALRRLNAVIHQPSVQLKYNITVRHLPYLLNPSAPEAEELMTMSSSTKPPVPSSFSTELYQMAARVQLGNTVQFRSNNLARSASTVQSHCLLKYCEMMLPNDLSMQLKLADEIYNSFLGNGKYPTLQNLSKIAETHCNFEQKKVLQFLETRDEEIQVRKEVYQYMKLGVKQLPFFVLNGKALFAGCQDPQMMQKALEVCPHM